MVESWMNSISPFVRAARIMKSSSLTGEWMDHDHVFTYIEQGEAEFFLSGVKYEAREGDILLMHPFMSHIIRSTSSVPLIQYIFHFDLFYDEERSLLKYTNATKRMRKKVVDREMKLTSIVPISHLQLADRIDLKKRFLLLHKEFLDKRPSGSLMMKAICLELLHVFLKNQADRKDDEGKMTKGWAFIERAINYIHDCFSDPQLNNASISEHVGVSTNHLSHLFKKQLGISIHKYVTHIRIEQAKKRIVDGKLTLTEVADEVGFSSIHLFSRSFKATVGIIPSKFAAMQSAFINENR
ncbi:AraC family transcriptional regulator [Cohnella sp. WQ 127256]|uniref:AraC family transcriptional regulator n=1 Tax=Cohnella sp. WQ 127256 TaxID=2938790 RepID=UPI00211935F4|nr:AraC family transcriptional regulator [Cohnella sp. WQ 127256]